MKAWYKRGIVIVIVLTFLLIAAYLLCPRPPEGAVLRQDVVSFCTGDATNDDTPELLAIIGGGETNAGERYGALLLVCDGLAWSDLDKLGYIPPDKIMYSIDLAGIKPMKVQLGDVTGNGVREVAICVYKTTKFYDDMAKRPFFFDLVDGNLIPIWLGSRLSRPFDDYILYDIDGDGIDELISIELLEDGSRVLAAYDWRGFGFELRAQSAEFNGALEFHPGQQTTDAAQIAILFSNGKEHTTLEFRLNEDVLVSSAITMN